MQNAFPELGEGAVLVDGSAPSIRHRRTKVRLTCHPERGAPFTVTGKTGRVLRSLDRNRDGITALDCIPWTVRLGSMIFQLRHRYGLAISTEMEPHEDGRHARYRLLSRVRLEA